MGLLCDGFLDSGDAILFDDSVDSVNEAFELFFMRNHDNLFAVELPEDISQSSQLLFAETVGRLVEDQKIALHCRPSSP